MGVRVKCKGIAPSRTHTSFTTGLLGVVASAGTVANLLAFFPSDPVAFGALGALA